MNKLQYGKCKIKSATLRGVCALPVDVEVSVFKGLPNFSIVGMPDSSIQESRERIFAAIKSSGFLMPCARIVVNLAPSHIRKTGSGFDLPIAIAILIATAQISKEILFKYLVVGELSLDGAVRAVPGILAFALTAKSLKLSLLGGNSSSQSVDIDNVKQYHINKLTDLTTICFHKTNFEKIKNKPIQNIDYKDIAGHDLAKRALQIAACGSHGVLLFGPPGSGKSMLASRLSTILPPLSKDEKMESAVIHSIANEDVTDILNGIRPFRSPHHSATLPGLIGGGNPTRPGEVSLAHNGVLYLDELAEFSAHVLQGVRQPMESGEVTVIRADGAVNSPAKFSLIAATNPCPCGYYGDPDHVCNCTAKQILNYQRKIGGPVLDRIDMHLDVSRINVKSVLNTGNGTSSKKLLEGVLIGREFASWRAKSEKTKLKGIEKIVNSCDLNEKDFYYFEKIAAKNNMSGRGIIRVLSVARTIADMEKSNRVSRDNLCEALTYRIREKGNNII